MRWLFPLCLIGLDLVTKMVAVDFIQPLTGGEYPYGGTGVFSNFLGISCSLNLVGNTGAAWGIGAGNPGLLFFIRIAIIGGLGGALYVFDPSTYRKIPILLIGSGAIGNAIDYLIYGKVIDFFHFVLWGYSFPVFNFADIYISLGAFFLLFLKKHKYASSVNSRN